MEGRLGQGSLSKLRRVQSDVQHTLPSNTRHTRTCVAPSNQIQGLKSMKEGMLNENPSRIWGKSKITRFGGEAMVDESPEFWEHGDFWNRDSLVRKWDQHQVRRQAAQSSHDVHRHDQLTRLKLAGTNRISTSGLLSAGSSFLEAWGFPLGLRDRQSRPTSLWWPVSKTDQFRSRKNFAYSLENHHSSRTPRADRSKTYRAETQGPQELHAGPHCAQTGCGKNCGEIYGSCSSEFWDSWDHSCKREGAKLACSIHGQTHMTHPWGLPHDKTDLRPGAIYSKKWKKWGPAALRDHVRRSLAVEQGKSFSDVDDQWSKGKNS